MTILKAGVSTFALLDEPDAAHNGLSYLTVEKDNAVAYVYVAVTGVPPGASLTSAILRLYTSGSWGLTPTVTVQAADAAWGGSSLTWNESPSGTGTTTTVTHASAADGDLFQATVTTQVAAMLAAGTNSGFVIARTDAGASKAFYSHLDPVYAPTLELAWTTVPLGATGLKPSGGRVVGTSKPTLSFDAQDVTAIQMQVDATAGTFSSPLFDSGTVVTTEPELDLSTTAYSAGLAGTDRTWRGRYKNSGGIWSPWSAVSHWTWRNHSTLAFTNPSPSPTNIVLTDTPTITATSSLTPVSWRMEVARTSAPMVAVYTPQSVASSTIALALPTGIIIDSSDMDVTLYVTDTYDREAVAGYPVEASLTQTFSFQDTFAVAPVDSLRAEQIGVSSFVAVIFTLIEMPEKLVVRRDDVIIYSADIGDPRFEYDPIADEWTFTDYTASGNTIHRYRVSPKIGGQVAAGGPEYDVLTSPGGINIADPDTGDHVFLAGNSKGSYGMGEVSAFYEPLRGTDGVRIFQSQRGYEGDIDGQIVGLPGIGNDTADAGYRNLLRIKAAATKRPMVVVIGDLAFMATLSSINPTQGRTTYGAWDVSLQFEQQGTTLWFGGVNGGVGPESVLLGSWDYEEGTDGAAVTTITNVGATGTDGAPLYEADAAMHGAMGWRSPQAVGGGGITYAVPYIGMASICFIVRASSSPGNLCKLGGTGAVTVKTGGNFGIDNDAGSQQSASNALHQWVLDKKMRADIAWTWSTGSITQTVRLFATPDAADHFDEFTATYPVATAPSNINIGHGTNALRVDYDSVRIYSGNSTWPSPQEDEVAVAQQLWSMPGYTTDTTCIVASQVTGVSTIDLALSTTKDADDNPITPAYVGAAAVSSEGIVKHNVTGKTANTVYYGKLATAPGVFVGDLIRFKTLPATNTAFTVTAVVGSCQRNASGTRSQVGWTDALGYLPTMHFHLGDFGYWGNSLNPDDNWQHHLDKYANQIAGLPAMRYFMAQTSSYIMADDHEFSSNNGDSNDSTDTGKVRKVNIEALQRIFGMYPLADPAGINSKRGQYGAFMIGDNIRVIMLDGQTVDRSLQADDESGAKSFIGSEQETWLRALLIQPAAVNLIVTQKALLGTDHHQAASDKPWNYATWRTALATFINTTLQSNGQPIAVYWIGGDRHANAYVSKTDNPIMPGHPALLASGWEHHRLPLDPGEGAYTASYGFDDNLDVPAVGQYVQLSIADDNAGTVTIIARSQEVHDTWDAINEEITDPTGWTVVHGWGGTDYTDTWTYP